MTLAKDEDNPAASLGSPALLDKFDRLRDLNISISSGRFKGAGRAKVATVARVTWKPPTKTPKEH
ncbi:hypothetical protein VTK56DRAFT_6215 [Thermocarpiscus australiensis]